MARKSKYQETSPSLRRWRPALYVRLSREDGDREESDSIVSQRELLTEFAAAQTDMTEPRLYADDGCTGTDFDRPAFQRMLTDLRAGVVDCVIVKDLSRFGRNYCTDILIYRLIYGTLLITHMRGVHSWLGLRKT